jgi:hypothetical protein
MPQMRWPCKASTGAKPTGNKEHRPSIRFQVKTIILFFKSYSLRWLVCVSMTNYFAPLPSSQHDMLWQSRLRRSVRLQLALSEPHVDILEAEARLRLVERQLLLHLLRGERPTPLATSKAHFMVQQAQTVLLTDLREVAAIRAEWPSSRALNPLRWATLGRVHRS